jgi:putative Holliday junction resolvase
MENGALDLDPSRLLPHACWMQRALGIDTGDARIGLALSDELRMLAHPLESVPAGKGALEGLASVVREKAVDTLVVGLPKNMNGTKGPAAFKAEAFAESLRALAPEVKIVLWDERLTTVAAQRALHEAGRNTRQSRAVIDQVAAQLILQGWLDSQAFLAQ